MDVCSESHVSLTWCQEISFSPINHKASQKYYLRLFCGLLQFRLTSSSIHLSRKSSKSFVVFIVLSGIHSMTSSSVILSKFVFVSLHSSFSIIRTGSVHSSVSSTQFWPSLPHLTLHPGGWWVGVFSNSSSLFLVVISTSFTTYDENIQNTHRSSVKFLCTLWATRVLP